MDKNRDIRAGDDMTKERSDERITFISKGLLAEKGEKFPCLLENVSTTGALIEMVGGVPDIIQVGDICTLDVVLLGTVHYTCRVVHLDEAHVGLQFLDQSDAV
jgi:hypothetical protein